VVPLRAGGGVRMKILEGMALGVPMISTAVGAEGLDLESGRELIIADTPERLAAEAVKLLRDPAAAARLARQARETAVRRFGWAPVVARLERVYETLVPATA
jgi:glycosyltransferase involved in cell wall biosynthesis